MNSNKFSAFHTHHMIIYVLVFIIMLIAAAWMYNLELSEEMMEAKKVTPATKQEIEQMYGQPVQMNAQEKAAIESIYGN